MGSATQDGTFENFVDKVKQSSLEKDRHRMRFSCQDIYVMRFKRGLWVNGKLVNTAHQRYETPYVKSLRQPETFEIAHQGYSLFLDFKHIKRLEQTHV
jgi:hypothetical protein